MKRILTPALLAASLIVASAAIVVSTVAFAFTAPLWLAALAHL